MPKQRYIIEELKGVSNEFDAPDSLCNMQVGDDGVTLVTNGECEEAIYCDKNDNTPVKLRAGLWECMIGCDQKGYASFSGDNGNGVGAYSDWLCSRKDEDCCGDQDGNPACRAGTITGICSDQRLPDVDKTCALHIPAAGVYQSPTDYFLDSSQADCNCLNIPVDCCDLNPTSEQITPSPNEDGTIIQANAVNGGHTVWFGQWVYYECTDSGNFAVCRKPAGRIENGCQSFVMPGGVIMQSNGFSTGYIDNPIYDNTTPTWPLVCTDTTSEFYDPDNILCQEQILGNIPNSFEPILTLDVDAGIPAGSCLKAELYIGLSYISQTETINPNTGNTITDFNFDNIEWQLVDIAIAGQGSHQINGWPPLSIPLTNDDLAIYPAFGDLATIHNGMLYSTFCCCEDKADQIIPAWESSDCGCNPVDGSNIIKGVGGITPEEFATTPDCLTVLYSPPANSDTYGGLNMGWRREPVGSILKSSSCITGFASLPPNENGLYGGLLVFGDMDTALITGNPYDPESQYSVYQYPSIGGMDKGTKPASIGNSVFTVWQGEVHLFSNGSSNVVSKEVYNRNDPFTEIVGEPQSKSIIAKTRSGKLLRFDFETESWSEIAICEGVDPCNLHLLPSPDCFGTRYYDDSTGCIYVITDSQDPPMTGELPEDDCEVITEGEDKECDCADESLPKIGYNELDADTPTYNKTWCSIIIKLDAECDVRPILCSLNDKKCVTKTEENEHVNDCFEVGSTVELVEPIEAKDIGGGYWKFSLPKTTYGSTISFEMKFCGNIENMKVRPPIILEYYLRGRTK